MRPVVVYVHGKGGDAREADRFKPLFGGCEVIGLDYHAETPWDARREFGAFADDLCRKSGAFVLIANSIGAYFSMLSFTKEQVKRAFFISPVVDMERLIAGMMLRAGVTEAQLREKKTIPTDQGETLSWEYLRFVRENPIAWEVPTAILYGANDALTPFDAMAVFADRTCATLTVMENGEHWFHTKEQLAYLDAWIAASL